MGSAGSSSGGTPADVQDVFDALDEPTTPLSTQELASRLDWAPEAVREPLQELRDRGVLQSRQLPDSTRVWWRSSQSADRRADQTEFRAFVSAVEDYAIFRLEPDGTVASWNTGAEQIKGYSEAEILGEHFSTFYTDEAIEAGVPQENLEGALREGRIEDEGWRVRADGSRFWANVTITAVRDDDGTLQGFTKVTRDMTERREYEQQLRRERDQTRQLLRTAPIAIAVRDADGETVLANERATDALGLPEREVLGGVDNPDDWTLYDANGRQIRADETPSARVLQTGEAVFDREIAIDPPDADRIECQISAAPVLDANGDVDRVITAAKDVTELKEREHQLEERKAELETELSEILGRVSDAFYALDDDWRFTHLNDKAAALMQRAETELLGEVIWDVFPGAADAYRDRFETAMETQEARSFEVRDDYLDAWLEVNVYPSETGLSIYFHDISARKEYEQKLKASNERLEQFAYAASHDLQEPLRMVSSYLQLIEDRYGDALDEDGREFIQYAVDGADRMREMIDALLAYSRVETRGEPFEAVDLDAVLSAVRDDLRLQIEESDARITAESLPTVYGDANQLRQVFQNLLENAIEYSGADPPDVSITATEGDDGWVISVSDEGIGIAEEDAEDVFEVFHRLHSRDEHPGTGIGLALCQRIVERHGGDIWVDSAPGAGATFSFTLPGRE